VRAIHLNVTLFALALCLGPALHAWTQGDDRRSRRDEQRKAESIQEILQQLSRLSSRANPLPESLFLHAQVSALLDRARQAAAGSYLFDRLESAMDELLDASQHILESSDQAGSRRDSTDEENRRTARDLERTYFRITQGDYFAEQSRESNATEYVSTARRLYQQARAAYDAADYRRSRRLAEAAQEVISGLESLAQAAVPNPEPPRLPEN
jgi:hypothetical protein